jgi:hypothetical protein
MPVCTAYNRAIIRKKILSLFFAFFFTSSQQKAQEVAEVLKCIYIFNTYSAGLSRNKLGQPFKAWRKIL